MPRRSLRFALSALVFAVVASCGVTVGLIAASGPMPGSLEPADAIAEVPVGRQTFSDERKVRIQVRTTTSPTLVSSAEGVVTSTSCAPGVPLKSTESSYSVDGKPILNLATPTPLWRDFDLGDRGVDVEQVQLELQRVGYAIVPDGVFGKSTLDAFRDALRQSDHPDYLSAEFTRDAVQWLPEIATSVQSCSLKLGHTMSAGSEVAALSTGVTGASVLEMPADLVAGPRTLQIDGTEIQADESGVISDRKQLQVLADLVRQQPAQSEGDSGESMGADGGPGGGDGPAAVSTTELAGTYALSEPVEIAIIPASAVTSIEGTAGCIVADGDPRAVTLVASALGKTFVTVDGDTPERVSIDPPKSLAC